MNKVYMQTHRYTNRQTPTHEEIGATKTDRLRARVAQTVVKITRHLPTLHRIITKITH